MTELSVDEVVEGQFRVPGEAHADALRAVLHGDEAQVVAEPIGRNTAPAITIVALTADPKKVHVFKDGVSLLYR